MSVTASGAVSTQHHQPTQEQIRLAQLIDDKKHDQPEVQEIVRKVLDVVADSNQEDALLALFDCDYDYEKAVALLIEKGHEVASEWRTATNHKLTKKQQQQQQQKVAATKNGHGDVDENGQQRSNDGFTSRGKSRGGRSRYQQNGGDSQNTTNQQQQQQNDNYIPQQRQRGGSRFRGRFRGNNRGSYRGNDRNYHHQQQQMQDSNVDTSSSSDTNRRNRGAVNISEQHQDQWDVGNWNGETLIYSRTAKDDEQTPPHSEDSSAVTNGQSNINDLQKSKPEFDPIEAARQIKSVIGIGQTSKPSISDQQQKSKPIGPTLNTKITPPPSQQQQQQQEARIPQQPVIFSDHFDGGMNKIDVQFGNLGESLDESSTTFYQQSESIPTNKLSQRTTEQSAHISSSTQPVINQQRIPPTQIQQQQQQPSMTMKPVVTPQYAMHQQQPAHQINAPNILLQSLLFHPQQQQPESVTLDTSYDPTTFSLPSIDFNSPYFMAAPLNQPPPPPQQQQTQPRYLVSQPPLPPQQTSTKNAQTPAGSATTSSTTAKKAPAVPPGMFPPTAQLPQQPAYPTTYGVQQQTGATTYSYDTEHLFTNAFMPLTNAQQTQSPTGTYGSVTPPVQQQQTNNNNDNKTMNFRPPLAENLMLLQQYQQYALQQSNNQQQGQQPGTHSPAQLSYYLSHPPSGAGYSPGHQMIYAQAATAMVQQQQQAPKQQGQQYNQNNSATGLGNNDDYYGRGSSSSSNKEGQYMYTAGNQPQHVPPPSAGQQQGVSKAQQQQQHRTTGNVYNNHQGQQRPY